MPSSPEQDPILRWLTKWGAGKEAVRAMILTSSRARPDAPLDALSDYDVILVVRDIHPFLEDESWLEDFGKVLVMYRDPVHLEFGFECFSRITQYEKGVKIDYGVCPVEWLRIVAAGERLPVGLDDGIKFCWIMTG